MDSLPANPVSEASAPRRMLVMPLAAGQWPELAAWADCDGLFVGAAPKLPERWRQVEMHQVRSCLGQECAALVFDARDGLDPDALGAVAGTLRAGGYLLLLTPPLEGWAGHSDSVYQRLIPPEQRTALVRSHFLARIERRLKADAGVVWLKPGMPLPALEPVADRQAANGPATPDQASAVDGILRMARGRPYRPVVLQSDRGRGKSAALGIAAARWLQEHGGRIVVTGPRRSATDEVFTRARRLLPDATLQDGRLIGARGELAFHPPDLLLGDSPPPVDLLFVDEAAGLPAPILSALAIRFPRCAFASTVHGYEGTGRGFALRFQDFLKARMHSVHWHTLQQPIRWGENDPLEATIADLLLLDAEPAAADPPVSLNLSELRVRRRDTGELAGDDAALRELFGLLVLAHYRTRPFDLRWLLDAPGARVYTVESNGHVLATALLAEEGGFDAEIAEAICAGRRRPQGHLLSETLAAHAGLVRAPQLHAARVVRIAVHPGWRRQGLGRHLLNRIANDLAGEFDYLGTSFGATPELLAFWRASGYRLGRVGLTRGSASGEYAVAMLRGLSAPGKRLEAESTLQLSGQLPDQLADSLRDAEPDLALSLLEGLSPPGLQAGDRDAIERFAHQNRGLETALGALRRAVQQWAAAGALRALAPGRRRALTARVLQMRDWAATARAGGYRGRAESLQELRAAVAVLLESAPLSE